MSTLDLELLRTFIAVVDHHGFAQAGTQLARTQSSVTQQMQRLEQQVGVGLFEKRGRQKNTHRSGPTITAPCAANASPQR